MLAPLGPSFPAKSTSLGNYEAKQGDSSAVVWKQASDIVSMIPRKQASFCGSAAPQLWG